MLIWPAWLIPISFCSGIPFYSDTINWSLASILLIEDWIATTWMRFWPSQDFAGLEAVFHLVYKGGSEESYCYFLDQPFLNFNRRTKDT